MSNPFATFRKNQKTWMAILVLVAIFAFVIAPVFDYFNRGSGGGYSDNAVAVKWKGGQFTRGDLANRIQKHSSLVRFMSEIAKRVLEEGGVPDVPGFQYNPATRQVTNLGISFSTSPDDVVRSHVLATYGKSLGVEFDDGAVDQFMQAYVDKKLSSQEVEQILRDASNGSLSYFEVCEMLKEELASSVVGQLAISSLIVDRRNPKPLVSPGKLYREFKKIRQSVKIEAFPVFADDYVSSVSESPSSDEIEAIYLLGAQQASHPSSPEPGFVRRYAANVEYVEANLQEWIDREKEKLTKEELRKEYDRRVELGQLKVPVETESDAEEGVEGNNDVDGAAETGDEGSTSETPPAEVSSDDLPPGDEDDSAPSNEESTDPESPADGAPASESGADGATSSSEDDKTGEDQSSLTGGKDFRFVATSAQEDPKQEEPTQEEPTQDDPKQEDPKQEDPKQEDPKQEDPKQEDPEENSESASKQTDEEDTAASAEEATTADATAMPAESEAGEAASGDESVEEGDAADDAPSTPEMRTQTFEEAKDTIADSLARDKAIPALDEALTTLLEDHMKPYYGKYRQYAAFVESGLENSEEAQTEPVKPDLKKLATDLGLKWGETGLVDGVAIAQTPFGLGNIRPDSSGLNGSVANVVMSPGVELYRPMQSSYFDQAAITRGEMPEFLQYLLWKTDQRQAYVPEKEEIEEEVIGVWKQLKARQLAENAAKELAKKVTGGEDPWSNALSGADQSLVVETDPFTWMSRLGDFMTVSAVNKLEPVGQDFMNQVFSTDVGGVAVGPTSNRNIFYVFRVTEKSPEDTDLQQQFNDDAMKMGPKRIAFDESQQLLSAWVEDLENDLELEWQMNVGQLN